MKFKDYFNRESNSNRIYSKREIREMKLKDFFTKENELISQYNAVGFPMLSDLKNSPNVTYVEDPNEVFGGRWESVRPVGVGGNDGVGVNDDNGLLPQAQVDGLAPQSNELGTITNGSTPVLKGGVNMNVKPSPVLSSSQLQKFNEDTQKQVKYGANSSITNGGPEITARKLYVSSKKPTLKDKYKGLTPKEAIGKALSKLPIPWTASQYYGHSAHLADGEKPSWYMRKNNDFYKYSDIADSDPKKSLYRKQAAKMLKLDINDPDLESKISDVQIVVPKANSAINNKIKSSSDLENYIGKHYDEIMNRRGVNDSINFQFGNDFNLWAVIHRADANVDKNSNDINIEDIYNYELWKYSKLLDSQKKGLDKLKGVSQRVKSNLGTALNNMAYSQQEAGQIANYILSTTLDLSDEEINQIYESYINKHSK